MGRSPPGFPALVPGQAFSREIQSFIRDLPTVLEFTAINRIRIPHMHLTGARGGRAPGKPGYQRSPASDIRSVQTCAGTGLDDATFISDVQRTIVKSSYVDMRLRYRTLLPPRQAVRATEELICDASIRSQGGLGLFMPLQRVRQRPSLRKPAQLQHQKVVRGRPRLAG